MTAFEEFAAFEAAIPTITTCPGCGCESSEDYDTEGTCWRCVSDHEDGAADSIPPDADPGQSAPAEASKQPADRLELEITTLEDFAAVEEPGADALLGDTDSNVIPEGSDVMFYGDGGAGKTTLTIDGAFHLGSGEDWLGLIVRRPVRVLIIEAEGPRPLLRQKLQRKLDAWSGPSIEGRVRILSSPWASFTFATEQWRAALAQTITTHEIDLVIAGPLTRIGMEAAGTLQEVVAFMALVSNVRAQCDRRVTLILVHHENKGGAVSGAWEGAGDTLLHVQAAGNGQTVVHVQKARWASEYHGKTLKLAWRPGESFEVEGDRDLLPEIEALLSDGTWRTVDEIREQAEAGTKAVRDILADHPNRFAMRTGEQAQALGRSAKAQLYTVAP